MIEIFYSRVYILYDIHIYMYDHKQKQEKYVRQDTELANRSIMIQTMRENMIIKAASTVTLQSRY